MLDIFVHYTLMLVAMTFNIGLFFAIVLGAGTGLLIFNYLKSRDSHITHKMHIEPINEIHLSFGWVEIPLQ